MMRENDTLTIKRSVPPRAYFDLLMMHQKNTNCKVVRVEALGSAIPTMVKFCELAQICDLATITKVQTKPRRMKVGQDSDLTLQRQDKVVCKFMECLKVDLQFNLQTAQPTPKFNQTFKTNNSFKPKVQKPCYNDFGAQKPSYKKKRYNEEFVQDVNVNKEAKQFKEITNMPSVPK